MSEDHLLSKINKKTLAVFITHAHGFNPLTDKIILTCKKKKIHIIEDVCESHGTTYKNKKAGTFGLVSNFSFYYAHYMSTIEGGMVSTNDKNFYETTRIMRSHGMHREIDDNKLKKKYEKKYKNLSLKFIFLYPEYNFRNNEIGPIIGISQLKRLNDKVKKRALNLKYFLKHLSKEKYVTNFDLKGNSNYAFPIILKKRLKKNNDYFEKILDKNKLEYRRGNAGGGNQIKQPYLKEYCKDIKMNEF